MVWFAPIMHLVRPFTGNLMSPEEYATVRKLKLLRWAIGFSVMAAVGSIAGPAISFACCLLLMLLRGEQPPEACLGLFRAVLFVCSGACCVYAYMCSVVLT